MSIAAKTAAILQCKADIKDAIESKGVTVGSASFDQYASKISQIQGGSAPQEAEDNDVNFYDYDGTRIASYTITEAKALTALPTPPTHEGLTFQEWNWTLADIQGYNRRYIDVGANYITTDEKTHLKTTLIKELDTSIYLWWKGTVTIDWGDGTTADSNTRASYGGSKFNHTYAALGDYNISIAFSGSSGDNYGFIYKNNTNDYWKRNLLINELNCGKNFAFTYASSFAYVYNSCKVSVATDTIFSEVGVVQQSNIPNLTIPKTSGAYTGLVALYANIQKICYPKQVTSFLGTNTLNGVGCMTRIVLPEYTTGTPHSNVLSALRITRILSVPNSWNIGLPALEEYDIVQGWVPSVDLTMTFSMLATNIVDFFNKLGTTSTTRTLTLGTTNLNRLTEEEKAIATNKGYTLA